MYFAMYNRLNLHVADSNREVVRRTRGKFHRNVRRDPAERGTRKKLYRLMIKEHAQARDLCRLVNAGRW